VRMTATREVHNPVFIVGGLFPALGVVQSLGARGVDCWVCDPKRSIAAWSKYARYYQIPDPRKDTPGMISRLVALAQTLGNRPVIIPTNDHFAQALAHYRAKLEKVAIPCVAPEAVVDLIMDKRRFWEWASEHSLNCPSTIPAAAFTDTLKLPVVVKPVNKSSFATKAEKLAHGKKPEDLRFTLIRSAEGWDRFRQENSDVLKDLIVQEFVPGTTADMYSIGVYADAESTIKGLFVGRKIRGYPAMYGNTKAGQNDAVPDHVLSEVSKIIGLLRYTGIAEFEYRREPDTDCFQLIEINPRCWSWIGITPATPVDIPWIAYQDLTGCELKPVYYNREPGTVKYVYLLSDLTSVLLRYRWDHPAWVMSPRKWWRSLSARTLVVAEYNQRDWPIVVWSVFGLWASAFKLLFRRIARVLTVVADAIRHTSLRQRNRPEHEAPSDHG